MYVFSLSGSIFLKGRLFHFAPPSKNPPTTNPNSEGTCTKKILPYADFCMSAQLWMDRFSDFDEGFA